MSDASPSSYDPAPQPSYYPQQQDRSERRGPGCFLWGCIIAVVLVVGGMTALVGGGYFMYAQVRDKYTDTQPMALPEIPLSAEERQSVQQRFDRFRESVDAGTATEPLVLNEDEINTLIAENDSQDPMKDAVRVQLEDDTVKGRISLPLDDIPLPGLKGRYLNGVAELRGSLKDGKLEVFIENASVKGEPLPESMMAEMRRENLTAEIMNDPEARKTLEKLESMEVRDGQLIIVPKAPTGDADGSEEADAAEEPAAGTPADEATPTDAEAMATSP